MIQLVLLIIGLVLSGVLFYRHSNRTVDDDKIYSRSQSVFEDIHWAKYYLMEAQMMGDTVEEQLMHDKLKQLEWDRVVLLTMMMNN
jgi:hypothetical protein